MGRYTEKERCAGGGGYKREGIGIRRGELKTNRYLRVRQSEEVPRPLRLVHDARTNTQQRPRHSPARPSDPRLPLEGSGE